MSRHSIADGVRLALILLAIIASSSDAWAMDKKMSESHDQHKMNMKSSDASESPTHDHQKMMAEAKPGTVGVDEKPGHFIPERITLRDETGQQVQLKTLVDRPTILLPVYFECPGVCGILMSSLAKVLREMPQ